MARVEEPSVLPRLGDSGAKVRGIGQGADRCKRVVEPTAEGRTYRHPLGTTTAGLQNREVKVGVVLVRREL